MGILDVFSKNKLENPWDKYYREEELNFEIPDKTMYEFVLESRKKYPKYKAIQYFNRKISYKELIDKIDKVAKSFTYYNIKKGDIVTICMPNTPEVLIALYALNKIGAVTTFLNSFSAKEEIVHHLNEFSSPIFINYDASEETNQQIKQN